MGLALGVGHDLVWSVYSCILFIVRVSLNFYKNLSQIDNMLGSEISNALLCTF